ncbi:FAD-binding and (Fe-S)-binding domain-containing protein [Tuwongella immobilis]|uniref:FAD-binding PCMH-type domain-containing protein n=1 Tax=Tuwongella immobilis TaxID=692036 RepID=A0A6C2YNF3_9BACT|nr:FAD-binding and (Fe-S)-binding domain-containing protein [Tuwongella immobilis]VIP03148.1 d-lactate dehydrogenase : D-lactate dehydrogenase (Cytochrome) OS=Pirellula staleyi (strain ATCC 27377 / DSM 6068 / ICPB 4128) GN=Psta_2342 PE=4 SV=1: FAD_binding_4: FAD-oxidase_C: Fer4_17: CCG [Tuwongella immobilis]VTS03531.1 d-lactate dehydrogenase : D-lactate dehydrogenase (Cytochrome) OS=Pirellula staleyi (strain ATCC 27377 / DSM 6068 / ICPB 4128) GN=Psta_2342 PE=4 SV=1: FAD_binding_4: FAD-oxidase_C: 
MTVTREQLREDLRGWFRGDVALDDTSSILYSTDASLFQVRPLAVASPKDTEDLSAIVRYAWENHLPIIPRGAGTGVAGESLGSGLIVDLSVHFQQILDIGPDWIRVQAGVTLERIQETLAPLGRRLSIDPASPLCTAGGVLATNASGSRAVSWGTTRDHVLSIRVCWDDGSIAEISQEPLPIIWPSNSQSDFDDRPEPFSESDSTNLESPDRTTTILSAVGELLRTHAGTISQSYAPVPFDRCGYQLKDLLQGDRVALARLLVGSEGTLGIATEITFRTVPIPKWRSMVMFGFETLDEALIAGLHLRKFRPTMCDLLDRRLLTLARQLASDKLRQVPNEAEAVLLVEFECNATQDARDSARNAIEEIQEQQNRSIFAVPALDEPAIAELWKIREMVLPSLYALGVGSRPLAFIEDIGLAPEHLLTFLPRALDALQRQEITATVLIHVHSGQIHLRPFLDLFSTADVARMWPLAETIYNLVLSCQGTISSQHGTGIARTPWVERQYPRLFPIFRELKAIFDPRGILNPGKIVSLDPSRQAWPMRTFPARTPVIEAISERDPAIEGSSPLLSAETEVPTQARPRTPLLLWEHSSPAIEAVRCNGCGDCRTTRSTTRMCPMFRVLPREDATPRAKANLFRSLLSGTPEEAAELASDRVREVADLCINCKMCARDCSAQVNIPKLMIEARSQNQAMHGLSRSDWVLARMEHFAAIASRFAPIVNLLLRVRSVRWAIEKLFGISRHRQLPRFTRRNFLKSARRQGLSQKPKLDPKTLIYFVDVFANYNDPSIAHAAVAVLKHHGYSVYVPPDQLGCGMAPLAQGDVETAREVALHHLRMLADFARDGHTIICSEPTAAVLLTQDYLDLLDDPDAKVVARQTVELTTFLGELLAKGEFRTDFQHLSLSIAHHIPCHVKALNRPIASPDLLRLIPGMQVQLLDEGCSGMAGAYGLKAENFERSLAMGEPMLRELAGETTTFGSTECSACRMQMEQGSGKRTLHPVQYLALAYNLMPELENRLRTAPRGLIS